MIKHPYRPMRAKRIIREGARALALVTKHGIRVVRYVHTDRGLVDVEELTPNQKMKLAVAIQKTIITELYRGDPRGKITFPDETE